MSVGSAQYDLLKNHGRFNNWLKKNFPKQDHEMVIDVAMRNAEGFRSILYDYYMPNPHKINRVIQLIRESEYFVGGVHGHAGSGKTSFSYYLLEELYNSYLPETRPKFIFLGLTDSIPYFFDDVIYDLNDVPNNCILYVDELGKYFPAREFQDAKLQSTLIDLRHFGIKLLGGVQQASLVDKTFYRFADALFFKYMNPDGLKYEREFFLDECLLLMIPRDMNDKNKVLVRFRGEYHKLEYQNPKFFTKDMSTMMSMIPDERKERLALSYMNGGMTPAQVKKRMATYFKFERTEDFYKDLKKIIF